MKAVVYRRYGSPDVLELTELPKPSPRDDEVLIRVRATTVTSADWRVRSLCLPKGFGPLARLVFGISRPRQPVLGTELAGDVEAVGKSVTKLKVGDRVFAFPGASLGAHAAYKCMRDSGAVAPIPANLSYGEAAALSFGGTTALDFLRRAQLKPGDAVLVNGASGSVGTALVQLAKHVGATVTAVCSANNLELVRSLGATHALDYTREDFTHGDTKYDIIADCVGTAPYARSRVALKDGGRLLLILASLYDLFPIPWVSLTTRHRILAGPSSERPEDLHTLARLAQSGALRVVVGSTYPFESIADAHRMVDTGHKRGNAVITLDD